MKMDFCLSVYTIEYGFVNMFKSKSLIDGLKTRICEKEYSTNLLHKNNIYGDIHFTHKKISYISYKIHVILIYHKIANFYLDNKT